MCRSVKELVMLRRNIAFKHLIRFALDDKILPARARFCPTRGVKKYDLVLTATA
jgi:hypothetical protein